MTNHLKMVKQFLAVGVLTAVSTISLAAQTSIKSVRLWHAPDYTRLVFDLSAEIQHSTQQMENPNRVVLDLKGTNDAKILKSKKFADSRVKALRSAVQAGGDLRVVLDTSANYRTQAFVLPPNGTYGHRLVIDLYDTELMSDETSTNTQNSNSQHSNAQEAQKAESTKALVKTEKSESTKAEANKTAPLQAEAHKTELEAKAEKKADKKADVAANKAEPEKTEAAKAIIEAAANKPVESAKPAPVMTLADEPQGAGRPMIIAIDAGHGGDDPGAIGHRGTREKNVTLAIARKLFARMAAEPGIKPVMTRTGDYFVPLDKRRQIARDRYKADLFLSIHADSFPAGHAFGASVYAISRKGATSATAARLAESENRADLVGGVSSAGKDDLLKSVLVDLSMDGTMEHSLRVGRNVLGALGSVGRLHRRNVEQAGFVVLKTADMPSILVETGFISTPEEESKLSNLVYQEQLSNAITQGVRRYFASNPMPGTYFASLKKHPLRADTATARKPMLLASSANLNRKTANDKTINDGGETSHVIGQGETLSSIAKKYRVSAAKIRHRNGMKSDIVQVGRTLQIPNT